MFSKSCPKCGGGPVVPAENRVARDSMHLAAHQAYRHPLTAVLALGLAGVTKLLARRHRCQRCGHAF